MGSLKTFLWAGMLAAASTAASAADMLPPPPPVYAPAAHAPVEIGSGWYLRGDVGVGIANFDTFEGVGTIPPGIAYHLERSSMGDQVFIGAGAGFQFNAWLRADVTAEYRTMTSFDLLERATFEGVTDGYNRFTGKLASFVFLANVYADLGTWHGITPFVGAGVGVASHRTKDFHDVGLGGYAGGFGYGSDKTSSHVAWALHAGLAYSVNQNLKLELAYRYLNMGKADLGAVECVPACGAQFSYKLKGLESHDLKIGMRWLLASPAPQPVVFDQPIIRKY